MPTIHFRGPMLYVFAKGTKQVTEIVMPRVRHGGSAATPHGGSSGKHADGCRANPHYTGILYTDGGVPTWFEDLDGEVTIEELDGSGHVVGGGCSATTAFESALPLLDRIANGPNPATHLARLTSADGAAKYRQRVAAAIPLGSGTMDVGKLSNAQFAFPPACTFDPAYAVGQQFVIDGAWTPRDKSHRVRVRCARERGTPLDHVLSPGDEMFFYTADKSMPTKTDLLEEKQPATLGLVDVDFKWVYQTIKAPGDDLKAWAKQTACNQQLPAPVLNLAPFAPDVSTCYPAGWQE